MKTKKNKSKRFLTEADLQEIRMRLRAHLFRQAASIGLAHEWLAVFNSKIEPNPKI